MSANAAEAACVQYPKPLVHVVEQRAMSIDMVKCSRGSMWMANLAVLPHVVEQRAGQLGIELGFSLKWRPKGVVCSFCFFSTCCWTKSDVSKCKMWVAHLAVLVHIVEDRAVLSSQEALHLLLKIILQTTKSTFCQVCIGYLKHLHNVETRLYCPHTFLNLDFQCRDGVSKVKWTFWDSKQLICFRDLRGYCCTAAGLFRWQVWFSCCVHAELFWGH